MNAKRQRTLSRMLVEDLPPAFVRSLIERFPWVYQQAHSVVFGDTLLGTPEKEYLLGYYRRSLAETNLRTLAENNRLQVSTESPEKGGCRHVRVGAGRFSLTMSHVATAGSFPQHSISREQYAKINQHLSQRQLFPVNSEPQSAQIYGIIVHTETPRQKELLGSLCIGFPDHKFERWIQEPTDFLDIRDLQQRQLQRQDDPQAQKQTAEPKWKKHPESIPEKDIT